MVSFLLELDPLHRIPDPMNRWTYGEKRFDRPLTRMTQYVHEDMEHVDAPGS